MATRDKRIDNYILNSAEFAWPIMDHLRDLVHKACPEVDETIKWSFPHFQYNGILCSMAAFKHHCAFGFWKASQMQDPNKVLNTVGRTSMGSLGRITTLKDLPSDKILLQYIKEAVKLNDSEVKLPLRSKPKLTTKDLVVPDDLAKALKRNKLADAAFKEFSYSNKKDYVAWINEAKTEATRSKRFEDGH